MEKYNEHIDDVIKKRYEQLNSEIYRIEDSNEQINSQIYKIEETVDQIDSVVKKNAIIYDETDLIKIEKEVIELSEVFNIVQEMVSLQKNDIDEINVNIDKTSEYIIISQTDLDEIEKSKSEQKAKKIMVYSAGVIIIAIPLSLLLGPIGGVSFAILGISSIKSYSILNK